MNIQIAMAFLIGVGYTWLIMYEGPKQKETSIKGE